MQENGVIYEADTASEDHDTPRKCHRIRTCCRSCCLPCRTKYHPLPENPRCWDRFKFAFMCPPHGLVARYLQFFCLCVISYAVLISVFKDYALPGGNFFSLCTVLWLHDWWIFDIFPETTSIVRNAISWGSAEKRTSY